MASILADIDTQLDEHDRRMILDWISKNYVVNGKLWISEHKNENGLFEVSTDRDVFAASFYSFHEPDDQYPFESLTNGTFEWKEVRRLFNCSCCTSLMSLEGAPKVVGSFKCNNCHSLKDLVGAPRQIYGDFDCSYCDGLKSLNGLPENINGDVYCCNCTMLESFGTTVKRVNGSLFAAYCTNLKSLKDMPTVGTNICIESCTSLTSLIGLQKTVFGYLDISYCSSIETLEGCPETIHGFFCYSNLKNLKSVDGMPKHVAGAHICFNCENLITNSNK